MKRFLTTALSVSLVAFFGTSTLFAGGEHCDYNKKEKQVQKNKDADQSEQAKQVQKKETDQNAAPNKTAEKKTCDYKKKKQSLSSGEKCDWKKKKKGEKSVASSCSDKDCEECTGKKGKVTDRHLKKLVDETLTLLEKKDRSDQKNLQEKLKTLQKHLYRKQKQVASKSSSESNSKK